MTKLRMLRPCQMVDRTVAAPAGLTPKTRVRRATLIRRTPSRRCVEQPFYTYCGNHPHRRPKRDPIPIGPVYIGESSGVRELWRSSPDTEEIRQHLLTLLARIQAKPVTEYPIGLYTDEIVVWQLGEFREARAIAGLQRIASFDPSFAEAGPFGRTRHELVKLAQEALAKLRSMCPAERWR